MIRSSVTVGLLLLAGCATPGPSGPDKRAMKALIMSEHPGSLPRIKRLRCAFIAEEGSEWRCRYQQWTRQDGWVPLEAYVARNGDSWVAIDGIVDPENPPDLL